MGHEHHHNHGHSNKKVLFFAFFITTLFALLEVIYGFITGSLLLLSEGGHMLSDGLSLGLAFFAVVLATKAATATKMFGYKRAEPIAAFLNGLGLIAIPIFVMCEAVKRLVYGSGQILSKEMLVVAAIGLVVNLAVAFALSRGEKDNINVRAAALHVLADLLSSVSTIIVSLLIMFFDFTIIDPIASIIVSLIILSGGWKITKESLNILMEGKPKGFDVEELKKEILNVDGVSTIKDIKVWSLSGDSHYMNAHITISDETKYKDIMEGIHELSHKYDLHETVQITY